MSTLLPENMDSLDRILHSRLEKCKAGILCPETLKDEAKKLREDLGWTADCGLLIAAGHQPVLYHPGLLMKDILADALARRYNGVAYNIVLDTDEVDLQFSYPGLLELDYSSTIASGANWPVRKHIVPYGNPRRIVGTVPFTEKDRNNLLLACEEAKKGLHLVLNPGARPETRSLITEFEENIRNCTDIAEPSMALRAMAHRALGISIRDVRASKMFRSSAFHYFARFVADRSSLFRQRYNEELHAYREERRIKNLAQPLPDLDDASGELPFWYIEDGMREPMTDKTFEACMEAVQTGKGEIYPRAITTSLFFRLFFCDLFIHGTGGGRYDRITENLIKDFFECDAAPYVVASASLAMEPRADLPVESREPEEVLADLRSLQFDPARRLSPDCSLFQRREELIQQWHQARRLNQDRSDLHREFLHMKRKARLYLRGKKADLKKELRRALHVQRARKIYADRSYPVFYYDLSPLKKSVEPLLKRGSAVVATRGS
ncbi:MAG: hypothetical protein KDK25_14090 [Leptospiraceae bacterium]|nr:hypothetical protein [Leptospiraceae bacterium]